MVTRWVPNEKLCKQKRRRKQDRNEEYIYNITRSTARGFFSDTLRQRSMTCDPRTETGAAAATAVAAASAVRPTVVTAMSGAVVVPRAEITSGRTRVELESNSRLGFTEGTVHACCIQGTGRGCGSHCSGSGSLRAGHSGAGIGYSYAGDGAGKSDRGGSRSHWLTVFVALDDLCILGCEPMCSKSSGYTPQNTALCAQAAGTVQSSSWLALPSQGLPP